MATVTRRQWLAGLGAAAAAAALPGAAKPRPNFVLFLADDLGWADLSCYGSGFYESPVLDRLARDGMRFTDAYAACPVCSPTRAALMTGKYPARVGLTDYLPGLQPKDRKLLSVQDLDNLPLEEFTIAEALKEGGYRTFMAGKWHLGGDKHGPLQQGFEDTIGTPGAAPLRPGESDARRDGAMIDAALNFIERTRDRPFFAYLPFTLVHTPINPYQPHVERFQRKLAGMSFPAERLGKERQGNTRLFQDDPIYASMVYGMDEQVGRVLRKLDELDLAGNTVVLFTSDNGGLCTHAKPDGGPTSNRPLRSGKGWCYEGGIRVPLIVRAPGRVKPGSECRVPAITNDFYPTLLEMAGVPLMPHQHCDGVSLAPVLRGSRSLDREAIYWHYPHYGNQGGTPGASVRCGDYKLIEFFEDGRIELYNLREDICEQNDLAEKMPDEAARLRAMLHNWQRSVQAAIPQPNPDYVPWR